MDETAVSSGIYTGETLGGGNFSAKNVIEDFMKTEYQEGLRNEFNTMDALINKLPKDTITGKVKYKAFALGITDNVRAVGSGTYDRYELGFDDFYGKGTETVEAQFDTTKLMATFSITDEAILKGTGDGSLIDVLKDSLSRMEIGLKHTYNRYVYGGHDGIIGTIDKVDETTFKPSDSGTVLLKLVDLSNVTSTTSIDRLRDNRGYYHNLFDKDKAPKVYKFHMGNSHSLIEGMGAMIDVATSSGLTRYVGRVWQKDNSTIHNEIVLFLVESVYTGTAGSTLTKGDVSSIADVAAADGTTATVYSRQLNDASGKVADEYHGLEDIIIRSDATDSNAVLFGVDRRVYTSLRCTLADLADTYYLNEETLRDMSDHLALTSPEGTSISIVCANHRIISAVEKSMYQFKNYNLDTVQGGVQLGGNGAVRFDNYILQKDKYARDNNVYLLDQAKIGELVRRDFTWITSGEVNGVLQRRPGTEMYEGIMNKYADMYIDAWRCHAAIKHCKVPTVGAAGWLSYSTDNGEPKVTTH